VVSEVLDGRDHPLGHEFERVQGADTYKRAMRDLNAERG